MNDNAGIATQFQRHSLLARSALKLPTHGGAAGESEHGQAVVADERSGIFVAQRQYVQRARRQASLLHDFRQQ